jgi:hypothetical protein
MLRDQKKFQVTWSLSLLGDQTIKITNLFTYKYVIIPHTKRGRDKKK